MDFELALKMINELVEYKEFRKILERKYKNFNIPLLQEK